MDARGRGFALIIVVVVTSTIFALAIQGSVAVRTNIVEVTARRDQARFLRDAESAARLAIAGLVSLRRGDDSGADAAGGGDASAGGGEGAESSEEPDPEDLDLPEMPPQIKELIGDMVRSADKGEANISTGFADRQRQNARQADNLLRSRGLPGRSIRVEVDDRFLEVSLFDRGGVLNPNVASEEQMRRYFAAKGVDGGRSARLAAEIADWVDEDSFVRPGGAEREEHLRRGVAIRNGPMASLDELLYLPSMTPDLLRTMRDDLTLASEGAIHAASAPEAVLLSVDGVDHALVDQLFALRSSGSLTEQALDEMLSSLEDEARETLTLDPSVFLSVRVVDPETRMAAIGRGVVGNVGLTALQMRLDAVSQEE